MLVTYFHEGNSQGMAAISRVGEAADKAGAFAILHE